MPRVRARIGRRAPALAAAADLEAAIAALPELDAREGSGAEAFAADPEMGSEAVATASGGVCAEPTPLYGNLQVDDDVVGAIKKVAEDVNALAVDYGETAWNSGTAAVLWVAGDATTEEEVADVEARFLAIEGVDSFVHSHEDMPDGWCDAEVVYGADLFRGSCEEQAAARDAELLALASRPLLP